MGVSAAKNFYAIQLFANTAIWISTIFIPNYAKLLGSSNLLIGAIGAANGVAIASSSYVFGRKADLREKIRYVKLGLALSSVACFTLFFVNSGISLLAAYTLAGFAFGVYPAALLSYVYETRIKLGRFSSVGSLGYCLGILAAGIIATVSALKETFLLGAFIFALCFLLSIGIKPSLGERIYVPFFSLELVKRNKSIIFSFLTRHVGAHIVWIIYPIYLSQLGATYFMIAVAYAVNSFGQFVFMYTISDRYSAHKLITAGHVFSMLTFVAFAAATTIWQILPAQLLLGASWSFLYVGSLKHMVEKNPEHATSVGLLNSTINISHAIGPMLGGIIAQIFLDYRINLLAATIMSAIALAVYLGLSRGSKRIEYFER